MGTPLGQNDQIFGHASALQKFGHAVQIFGQRGRVSFGQGLGVDWRGVPKKLDTVTNEGRPNGALNSANAADVPMATWAPSPA
jgi:hypothetical protein